MFTRALLAGSSSTKSEHGYLGMYAVRGGLLKDTGSCLEERGYGEEGQGA